ncbi:hypothetical protein GIB67_027022 [Kingdonia uniflora]|uniref:WRKY domain-containing protein n=1 Tax=Kingdonia uniflora TaxID=39325 RepID=A0A7J7P1I3_9MAGN|nr:hypothetical protein GIB67_027022 [Kingdonia uniflora]
MDGRFNTSSFVIKHEDQGIMPEMNDSPPSSSNVKLTTNNSLKRSRRAVQKRVVSIPFGDVDSSRLKGEGAPPSDSWAWRKYGQKPIKGSPYPRGYYRCSSSKGCPARKQVERSRVDPAMLVITYACDHNHAWPTSKNSVNVPNPTTTTTTTPTTPSTSPPPIFAKKLELEADNKFSDLADNPLVSDDFMWFSDVTSTTMLESSICTRSTSTSEEDDMAMGFPMGEEDESLFADLGELPECSVVFRRGFMDREEERRRCNLRVASWCEST